MTCREAQSCIVPFIEDKMDDERMEQFLHHIENCSECYDELEVYFIVFSGIRQLDNDQEDISDFKGELKKYIQSKKEKYHKKHKRSLWIRVSMAASVCLIAAAIGIAAFYRFDDTGLFEGIQRQIDYVSGNYTVSAVHKRPRDAVCRYLTKNDGTIKIIREVEEDQDGVENRSD